MSQLVRLLSKDPQIVKILNYESPNPRFNSGALEGVQSLTYRNIEEKCLKIFWRTTILIYVRLLFKHTQIVKILNCESLDP